MGSTTESQATSAADNTGNPLPPIPSSSAETSKDTASSNQLDADSPAAITTTTSHPSAAATTTSAPHDSSNGQETSPPTTPFPATSTAATPPTDVAPSCTITLLLTSGARHPYKIDEKYLAKRNVNVPAVTESGHKDPFSISVYTLKELILREWREEWETQPSSPSSIRLIHFGRLLDDKAPLSECRFNVDTPNVVHMTVKPQEMIDEEDASKGKSMGRDRGDGESTAGCRCVIL